MPKTSIETKYKTQLSREEQETHIHYEYDTGIVKFRTTFYHIYKALVKRLEKYNKNPILKKEDPGFSYYIEVNIDNVRNPFTLISSKHKTDDSDNEIEEE